MCAVGAAPEQVVAFGDGYNDLSMLLWAGTGVAMGNADARVKYRPIAWRRAAKMRDFGAWFARWACSDTD